MTLSSTKFDYYHDIIDCLSTAMEERDHYTAGHSNRVADLALDIAQVCGLLGEALDEVHIAGHLHDIGKIGVSEAVLNNPGRLNDAERREIQKHPEIGFRILSKSVALKSISEIVLYHHEWWNGKGYPHGIKGAEIPLGARIIAIADSIDAMTSHRPYREALTWEACLDEIVAGCESQFDPLVAERVIDHWPMLKEKYSV